MMLFYSLLYPRGNRETQKLEYYCKQCPYVKRDIQESIVFINELEKDSSTRLENVLSDLSKDPTLSRTREINCMNCNHNEAAYFQADLTPKSQALKLIFICCGCGEKWEGD